MTGRSLPGCQYMLNWANHRHRESLIHSVEKRSLSRIDPSVIFPLRSAVKWAILKYKMLGLEADACCCEVYLLTFASSDAWVEGRKQIMYATNLLNNLLELGFDEVVFRWLHGWKKDRERTMNEPRGRSQWEKLWSSESSGFRMSLTICQSCIRSSCNNPYTIFLTSSGEKTSHL